MKKSVLRKLREVSEEVIGKEETNKIINKTLKEVLEETKPKKEIKENIEKKNFNVFFNAENPFRKNNKEENKKSSDD